MANINKSKKSETGSYGEDIACQYLIDHQYKIIERNFWKPWGEIDIIARDNDATIVFVEVKALRKSNSLIPEDNMSAAKISRIKRTVSLYIGNNSGMINEERGFRIDLIAIDLDGPNSAIRHHKNI